MVETPTDVIAHCMPMRNCLRFSHPTDSWTLDAQVLTHLWPDEQLATATIYNREFNAYNEVKEFI